MLFLHLSNIQKSPISFGGNCKVINGQGHVQHSEHLLQALEINRKLIAAIFREWDSEDLCLIHSTALIQESNRLELTVAEKLKEK
ncbi:MAG: hypothetical protein PSV36_16365 [Algoriphagus sp.]|nr:hypothetical protein [Algoriphagus sp.]